MANNPMFGTHQTANNATAPSNPLNSPDKRYFRGRNYFPYDRKLYGTFRYADIMPFECVHGVEGDILNFGSFHQIRSGVLSSVMQSPVHMKKTYTLTDMKCILPRNWDIIYKVPVKGDDVPDYAYTSFPGFFRNLNFFFFKPVFDAIEINYANPDVISGVDITSRSLTMFFKYLLLVERVYSNGSLLPYLGFHTTPLLGNSKFVLRSYMNDAVTTSNYDNFDDFIEKIYSELKTRCGSIKIRLNTNESYTLASLSPSQYRYCLEQLAYNIDSDVIWSDANDQTDEYRKVIAQLAGSLSTVLTSNFIDGYNNAVPLNIDTLCAYQISCATFFSRDSVDDIISAETYRNLMEYYYNIATYSTNIQDYFVYNGVRRPYDVLSSHSLLGVLRGFSDPITGGVWSPDYPVYGALGYLFGLFNINPSLRFGDYFTGSKIEPLAVGDVTASVNNGAVNALDITVSTLKARFLNAVNRARNTYKSFIEDVMDGDAPPRDDEPRWLSTVTSRVSGFEVENTATSQGEIVTLLKSSDSKYIYELEVGTPCIVLGLLTFEIPRVYSRTVDRFYLHKDRYDMFNKFMQYTGDQEIKNVERNASINGSIDVGSNFAYTPRHMEYKQRFPIAVGDYVDNLSSYLFVTDNAASEQTADSSIIPINISSHYIRSRNYEFDRFFDRLNSINLCHYYHFYIEFDNICRAYRKMEKNPTIL